MSTEQDMMKIIIKEVVTLIKIKETQKHFNARDILILEDLPPLAIFHYRNNNSQLSVAIQHNY